MNRLRTGYTCSKEQRKKWGYFNGDTTCECWLAAESTSHMLQCSLLAHPCTMDNLLELNDPAQACTERWKKIVWWHDMMMMHFKINVFKYYSGNIISLLTQFPTPPQLVFWLTHSIISSNYTLTRQSTLNNDSSY